MLHGKVLVAQGGGPTAVINESMVGTVIESRKIPAVDRVYGAYHGVRGIINEEFLDLTARRRTTWKWSATRRPRRSARPATSRMRSTAPRSSRVLRAHGIEAFRGNDLRYRPHPARPGARRRYPLTCVHVPKTIDNDLVINDHTPGFPSAARFVALAFAGANLDNRALPGSMSRSSWDAMPASSPPPPRSGGSTRTTAPRSTSRAPFSLDQFAQGRPRGLCQVRALHRRRLGGHPRRIGEPVAKLAKEVERDAHGLAQLSEPARSPIS